jgi:hypothetical protein
MLERENMSMNSQATGLKVAAIIFGLFAIGHAVRLFNHTKVLVAGHQIPMGASWVGLIIAALLSIWMWRLSSRGR